MAQKSLNPSQINLTTLTGALNSFVVSDSPSANVDNYAPTGYVQYQTNALFLTPTANIQISGLLAANPNQYVTIVNLSSQYTIEFMHQNSSTTTNQFSCLNGQSEWLYPYGTTVARYIINQWILS